MKSYKIKYSISEENTSLIKKILDKIEKQKYIRKKEILFDKEKKELIIKLIGFIPNIKAIIGEKGELIKSHTFIKFQHIIIRKDKFKAYQIKYIKNPNEKIINIFSEKFVKENAYNSVIIYNDELYKINSFIGYYATKIEKIKDFDEIDFKYVELRNISDRSYMFHNCNLLKEYKIFEDENTNNLESTINFDKPSSPKDSIKNSSVHDDKDNNNISSSGKKDIFEIQKLINCKYYSIKKLLNKSKTLTSWNEPKYKEWFQFKEKDNNLDKILNEFNKYSILGFSPNTENIELSNVNNLSHMFDGCTNLISIPNINTSETVDMSYMLKGCILLGSLPENLSKWKTDKVKNISHMFDGCQSLKSLPDLSKWNTKNVHDMNSIFKGNSLLLSIPFLSKWKLDNVTDMSHMFEGCSSLNPLSDISEWNTKNIIDMNSLFNGCSNLISLPNISKWDTNNVKNIQNIFKNCSSLTSLPDISNWNINNVIDMSHSLEGCSSLNSLPDISNWNTNNVNDMSHMFEKCSNLNLLPDISNWNTNNVNDMSHMFQDCSGLSFLPNISLWNTKNVTNMNNMFEGCSNLISLPNISNWNIENIIYMNYMFKECSSLISLPDISNWNIKSLKEMSNIFSDCSSLFSIPDISNWDLKNIDNINSLFENCCSLTSVPRLSNLNDKIINLNNNIFKGCVSLSFFDNSQLLLHENIYNNCINAINTTKVQLYKLIYDNKNRDDEIQIFNSEFVKKNKDKGKIAHKRDEIKIYPLKESFKPCGLNKLEILFIEIENISDKSYMFKDCILLEDFSSIGISKINVYPISAPKSEINEEIDQTINLNYLSDENKDNRKIDNLSHMFDGCSSLLSFGGLSNWNSNNIENMSYMFNGCKSLNSLPDLSKWEIQNVKNIDNIFKGCSTNYIKFIKNNTSLRTEGNSPIFEYLEKINLKSNLDYIN